MKRRLILWLAPAVLAVAPAAYAQHAGHAPPGAAPSPEMAAHHDAMRKQRLEDLKTVLRLRPDQEPALAALLAAHGPDKAEDAARPEPKAARTTPERLDEMARRDARMSAERESHRAALARFYAVLSPEQQKVFDALRRLRHDPGMGGGRHGGMGHGKGRGEPHRH